MPSAGRPKVSTRLDQEVVDQVVAQIALTMRNENRRTVLDNEVATFVEVAIREKLAKMKRCREWAARNRLKKEEGAGECQSAPPV